MMQNRSNKPVDLYLVSSPLHFFWAWLLADRQKDERDAHLWLIDQYSEKPMVFTPLLDRVTKPFVQWQLLAGREAKGWAKWRQRKKRFAMTEAWCAEHRPARVLIGNDRSVLGQFVLKTAKQLAKQQVTHCTGVFLDDGVFSYLGRAASKAWSERVVDNAVKKLVFGRWYDTPETVGASRWVDEAWLMFPHLANDLIKQKNCKAILKDVDIDSALKSLQPLAREMLADHYIEMPEIQAIDVLITLPNHRIFNKIKDFKQSVFNRIRCYQSNNKTVAVKYHPAAGNFDLLNVKDLSVEILPSKLSFELLLPFLGEFELVGEMSSTLLLTHYLVPSMTLKPIDRHLTHPEMLKLLEKTGVKW